MSHNKPHIRLIATGGTIAGQSIAHPRAENSGQDTACYQAGTLSANELLSGVPELCVLAEWSIAQPYQIGSQHLTPEHMIQLRNAIVSALEDSSIHAIVVTHGTDTLEDALFFMYLTLPVEQLTKPVVFTAAMLPSDHPKADGPENLRQSFAWVHWFFQNSQAITGSHESLGLVMNGKFTPAPWVRKRNTAALDAFDAPESLSIPPSAAQQRQCFLALSAYPTQGQHANFKPENFVQAHVPVVYCTPNQAVLDQLMFLKQQRTETQNKPRSVIIAAPGHGNIPDSLLPCIQELLREGVRIIRSSRISDGGVQAGGEFTALDEFKALGLYLESGELSLPQAVIVEALR